MTLLAAASLLLAANIVPPAVNFDPAVINSPNQPPILMGQQGPSIVRAQVLLDRAHFSCGEIDGNFGSNLQKTVAAFQRARRLPASGQVDAQTWGVLNADKGAVIVPYTITAEDVKGPFVKSIPGDLMQQAKLPALSYTSPLEEIGEKFHVSPALLTAMNPGKDFGKASEQILVTNVAAPNPQGPVAAVLVSKSDSSVTAVDPQGRVVAYYSATIGSQHDPLPIGHWKITNIEQYPKFHYNAELFWDAKNPHEKAVLPPGPNNPVGVVWMQLSVPHYGIHGTPEPGKIGHTYSHGCIRLTNWDAWQLANMIQPNTPAILTQ